MMTLDASSAMIAPTPADALLAPLNPEQRQAVETTQGPVLVLAGAGTGKTRVLTTRIAYLLVNRLAFPGEILAVTFTNKAAREMAERVEKLLGHQTSTDGEARRGSIQWMGTFHSVCARIIRRHAEKLGLTSSFTILDDDDQQRLIKAILVEQGIDGKTLPPKLFNTVIQSWKDQGLSPAQITSEKDLSALAGHGLGVYKLYQARLKQINACDFGDLLLHALTLFAQHQEVLAEYARRFKYILVDALLN